MTVRFWLRYGLGLGSTLKGFGPGAFVTHIKFWHAGIWFALEGGWVLVFLAGASLWLRGHFGRLVFFLVPVAGILLGGFANGDVVRTTIYLLPAIFVSLKVLSEQEGPRHIEIYCFIAFLISALGGNYNVYLEEITWFMPLPVYLLSAALNGFVTWAKISLGWHD